MLGGRKLELHDGAPISGSSDYAVSQVLHPPLVLFFKVPAGRSSEPFFTVAKCSIYIIATVVS